ncbi:hypothetical protein JAAARDRAFT_74483 [Jaapia argillacea MUCL 33604]|uniref:Uncharacterized protein n=1 Tax=Jaapia argillacea MUCL 33604 TaxID=933084 RepID=A0A067P7P1_9AGAM|nr:hypothetical protein JAAARDRAFT_74483 [Jaapia argillacea MUCL 33604]
MCLAMGWMSVRLLSGMDSWKIDERGLKLLLAKSLIGKAGSKTDEAWVEKRARVRSHAHRRLSR